MKNFTAAIVLICASQQAIAEIPVYAEIGTNRAGVQIGQITAGLHSTKQPYAGVRVDLASDSGLTLGVKVEVINRFYYARAIDAMSVELSYQYRDIRFLVGQSGMETEASISYKW